MMDVIRTFKPQPLDSAKDLRDLRVQLRAASAGVQADSTKHFEFMGACTSVARNMLHRPGKSEVSLAILRDNLHEGLRATFVECLSQTADPMLERAVDSLFADLHQHGLSDIDQLVDRIDVDRRVKGRAVASLVKWIN